ncbi:PadR family transcriptional regulator [Paenibacillus sp. GP183]|jgi:DNA-binding PadR family transcriptional regulator|uniref:PadR family transcriptional regulator n=1 Tax=Paenibacillus sp. GP183 TaxID=1882751 RepID=UPI000895B1AE|nr:PadR family transcriptional regulator [Paenibacillus sp. GP183]SEC28590.1 DNA-binding transcriptional regulator, PadR family [Paenibacillus sp. GP183]
MPKPKRSNLLALAILSLLHERPMHPYEIGVMMRQRGISDSIKLNTGSLYAVIEALWKNKLIQTVETKREGKHPERTIYEPTAAGKTEFFEWLRFLLRTPVKEYPQFAAGLSFLGHLSPRDTLDLLKERAGTLVTQIQDVRSSMEATLAMGIDRLFVIEMEYSLALLEAEQNWLGELINDIENGVITERKKENLVWVVNYKEPSKGDTEDEISKNHKI